MIIILIGLFVLSLILERQFFLAESLRIVFGGIGVLFLPGFFFSFIFFPQSKLLGDSGEGDSPNIPALDAPERIIISLFLSMVIIALVLFTIRQIRIPLSPLLITLIIILINVMGIGSARITNRKKRYEDITY